ncbi:MAG: sigma-70 family RNA polymerase sigma factor [Pyrinomonadaceae bacterium]
MTNNEPSHPDSWIEQHGDYLFRYAIFRLRDAAAAEDAVQETLLAALQSNNRFAGRSSERTWLIGILKHKIIDLYRRIRSNHEVGYEGDATNREFDAFEKTGEWAGHWRTELAPSNWQLDASATLERKEFWETLDRCLAELPRRTAMAFVLREVDGLSSEEICALLNLSRNNLWVMLHRARLKLRNSLEAEWFRSDPGSLQLAGIAHRHSGVVAGYPAVAA